MSLETLLRGVKRFAALGLVAYSAFSCGGNTGGADGGTPVGCTKDSDCKNDRECDYDTGKCVPAGKVPVEIDAGNAGSPDGSYDARIDEDAGSPVAERDAGDPGFPDVGYDAGTVDASLCIISDTQQCGTTDVGECAYGTQTCNSSGEWGSCNGNLEPLDEICDEKDNDCDGLTDNVSGSSGECFEGDAYLVNSCGIRELVEECSLYCLDGACTEEQFVDLGNGTIYDNETRLTWQKTPPGNYQLTASDAASYCDNFVLAGSNQWRIPTKDELLSIFNLGGSGCKFYNSFAGECKSYWSSTECSATVNCDQRLDTTCQSRNDCPDDDYVCVLGEEWDCSLYVTLSYYCENSYCYETVNTRCYLSDSGIFSVDFAANSLAGASQCVTLNHPEHDLMGGVRGARCVKE